MALKGQSYKNIEINIIDNNSTDETILVAQKYGVNEIKTLSASLLRARYEGTKLANGKYILILDSDQILKKDAIERAVWLAEQKNLKMLALGEVVFKADTFVEKLFELDRKLINSVNDLSPFTGVIMPRFFETGLLRRAYENIPATLFANTGGPDHAIVYYEAWQLNKNIGVLPNAIKHLEPRTILRLWPKFYRWGYTSVDAHFGKYKRLMTQKERFRTGLFEKGLFVESIGSIILLILKGIGFKLGYYQALIDRILNRERKF